MKSDTLFSAFIGLFLLVISILFLTTLIDGLKSIITLLAIALAVDYIIAFFLLAFQDDEETNEDTNN